MKPLSGNRISLALLLAFALFPFIPTRAHSVSSVTRVRHSVRSNCTRIVLDLTSKTSYRIVRFEKPERIAINLKRVRARRDVQPFSIARGVVEQVRVNRLSWGSQIVLDLRGKATWKDFTLGRAKGRPDRIVLDVYQTKATGGSASARLAGVASGTRGGPQGRRAGTGEYIVAIDAGHGGMDPGALGKYGLVEKHLALDLAKRIASELKKQKGVRTILTRTKDVYLTLPQRTRIAQRRGADIFVSVHLNAARSRKVRGAEVFFISPAGAEAMASKLLSDKNRATSELGLKGAHSDELLSLLMDVNQHAMMYRSSLLAEEIHASMQKRGFPPSRGVKQRSFAVLKTIVMPSVLVEPGFISNSTDARFLKDPKNRATVSRAIASGIVSFLKRYPPPASQERELIVHKVKKGDTLWRISRLYGTTVTRIREANGIAPSNMLHVGQELIIISSSK